MKKIVKIEHDLDYEPKYTKPKHLLLATIIACILGALLGIFIANL